jgi:hypothetical protein
MERGARIPWSSKCETRHVILQRSDSGLTYTVTTLTGSGQIIGDIATFMDPDDAVAIAKVRRERILRELAK